MTGKRSGRSDVIMAGVGGRGVLMAGLLLTQAGMNVYQHVSWSPTYGGAMRGGLCECTVVLSDDPIVSPVLSQADAVIAIDATQAGPFEKRVKPGGFLIVEQTGLDVAAETLGHRFVRDDVIRMEIEGIRKAVEIGSSQVANFVLLGAYIEATQSLSLEVMEEEMEKRLTGKRAQTLLALNKKALSEGAFIAADRLS